VGDKYVKLFNHTATEVSPTSNYAQYRHLLSRALQGRKRFIPIMAVILKDLTAIEEANPDVLNESDINTQKTGLLQDTYETMHRSRVLPYKLSASKADNAHFYAVQVFERLPRLSQDQITKLSHTIRPPGPAGADKQVDTPTSESLSQGSGSEAQDDASGSTYNDLVDLPLDLSSLSDKSFLAIYSSQPNSSRASTAGFDVKSGSV
jgi:hypothetical protein